MKRRIFNKQLIASGVASVLPGVTRAADKFPSQPVKLIVMFPPGGGTDITARFMGAVIEKYLGQPFTIINKAGAAGLVAGSYVARSAADDYTMGALVCTGLDPVLFKYFRKPSYSLDDFTPVARVVVYPYGLCVNGDSQWKTLVDLIAYVKGNPGTVTWGHQGVGHSYHLRGMALIKQADLKMNDVAFAGSSEEVVSVLGGKINSAFISTAGGRSFIRSGELRMLALQHPQRLPYLPNVPTFAELGYETKPPFPMHYTGMVVPKGTPADRVAILGAAVKSAMEDPQFISAMKNGGSEMYYGTPDQLMADVTNMRQVYGEIFKELGTV